MKSAVVKVTRQRGFTLLELLVAVAILGIALVGMYSLYMGMQRTTYNQEEVVDIQQSLRVALDIIGRDIKMAGLLVPTGTTGIAANSNATTLNIETASAYYNFAQVRDGVEVTGGTATAALAVTTAAMTDLFTKGNWVRVIRPQNGDQPANVDLEVDSVFRGDADYPVNPLAAPPTITIKGWPATESLFLPGDIIARVTRSDPPNPPPPDPSTISWTLAGTDLVRNADGQGNDLIAENIVVPDPLDPNAVPLFTYQLDDGSEVAPLAPNVLTAAQLARVVAVRVTITANTVSQLDGTVRPRSVVSVIRLRN
ncbi:hypothetical protein JCM30471_01440 [Desulfuromonas carbonis]